MRRVQLIILIGVLLLVTPLAHAQNDPVFELPAIADGDTITNTFEDTVTTYLYAFNASEGDSVSISMVQLTDDLDPFLVLLDSTGAVLAYDDDSGAVALSALIEDAEIEDNGVYFVLATSFNFVDGTETTTDDVLPYELTITGQTTPEDVEDADVITLEVEALQLGNIIEGEIDEDAPAALLFFEGEAGDSTIVSIEDAEFISVLQVFAPDGSRIGVDPSFVEIDLEDDGMYVIIATDFLFYEAIDDDGFFEGGAFILVID